MKSKILLILSLFFFKGAMGQQDFRFKYKLSSEEGSLIRKEKTGIWQSFSQTNFELLGLITKTSDEHDTLYLKFWPFKTIGSGDVTVNSTNYCREYALIPKWQKGHVDIPFVFTQFTATSLPMRFNLVDKTVVTDFSLNANLALFRIYGRTRYFHNSFVAPRNRSFGWGIFTGISSITGIESKNELGVNYGLNFLAVFYNLNIVPAIGIENNISRSTHFTPYFGLGVGFKIISLSGVTGNQ